jgi:hypothetical protein
MKTTGTIVGVLLAAALTACGSSEQADEPAQARVAEPAATQRANPPKPRPRAGSAAQMKACFARAGLAAEGRGANIARAFDETTGEMIVASRFATAAEAKAFLGQLGPIALPAALGGQWVIPRLPDMGSDATTAALTCLRAQGSFAQRGIR